MEMDFFAICMWKVRFKTEHMCATNLSATKVTTIKTTQCFFFNDLLLSIYRLHSFGF